MPRSLEKKGKENKTDSPIEIIKEEEVNKKMRRVLEDTESSSEQRLTKLSVHKCMSVCLH